MPELPEVETVMRALTPILRGQTVVRATARVKKLRTPIPARFAKRIEGQTIKALARRAKYILITLSGGEIMVVHLGMTGGFFERADTDTLQKHDHVVFELGNGKRVAFHDPRRFGSIDLVAAGELDTYPALAVLGPEPLADAFTPKVLADALKARKTSMKATLLNQHVVAGLGNIYVSEALFLSGIHPERLANTLTPAEVKRLHPAIKQVLQAAIAAGGSTLRDYRHPDGELGFFQDQFAVYGRAGEKCPGCTCAIAKTGGVRRIVQNGRSTFFCDKKQR